MLEFFMYPGQHFFATANDAPSRYWLTCSGSTGKGFSETETRKESAIEL
jgi:hypothetical protein